MGEEGIRVICAVCGELLEERTNLALSGRVTYLQPPNFVPCPTCGSLEQRTEIVRSTGDTIVAGSLRITLRSYLSSHLLWIAQHEAELAKKIETANVQRDTPFSIEDRCHVLSSIVASVSFLEAMVNELYQDAADDHTPPGGHIAPLSPTCRRLMANFWQTTRGGMVEAIEKYERLLDFAGAESLDRGGQLYEDTVLVVQLRNAIVHFRPESRSAEDEADRLERALSRKFAINALWADAGNPWWPDKALGHGAAEWAHLSVRALADHVLDAIGVVPIYRKVEAGGWFGQMPDE